MKLRRDVGTLRTKSKIKVLRSALAACRLPPKSGGTGHSLVDRRSQQSEGAIPSDAGPLHSHRKGAVFLDRYHVHILKTPREVRNGLAYVLNNARRHAAQRGVTFARTFVDAFSSWQFFDG